MINKQPESGNKTSAQILMGNTAAKKIVHQHLEHHDFYFRFELNSGYFLTTGLLEGTKRLESFCDRLAESLLKAMKLFRLK